MMKIEQYAYNESKTPKKLCDHRFYLNIIMYLDPLSPL